MIDVFYIFPTSPRTLWGGQYISFFIVFPLGIFLKLNWTAIFTWWLETSLFLFGGLLSILNFCCVCPVYQILPIWPGGAEQKWLNQLFPCILLRFLSHGGGTYFMLILLVPMYRVSTYHYAEDIICHELHGWYDHPSIFLWRPYRITH